MKLLGFVVLTAIVPVAAMFAAAEPARADASSAVSETHPQWRTIWRDDFDGEKLDATKWKPERSCWGGGNNERQCYTSREQNVRVDDGVLRLVAQRETYTGPLYPEGMRGAPGGKRTQKYTSGKVRTRGLAEWRYGRFSARMKLPPGQGVWSAFWMMPAGDVYGNWPLSGELDIMEAVNLGTPCADCPGGVERRTSGAIHFGKPQPENTYWFAKTSGERAPGPSDEWRTYSVEWAQGIIQWMVDGEVFLRLTADEWYTSAPKAKGRFGAPFDQPFYLMLNLAVGGNLAEQSNGGGFAPSAFPAEVQVDWVSVDQCDGDPDTGRACLDQQAWEGKPMGPWETQAR